MPAPEHDPSSGGLDPNRVIEGALTTYLSVVYSLANNQPADYLAGILARGVADYQAAVTDGSFPMEQRLRAARALQAAGMMADGRETFVDMVWVEKSLHQEPYRVSNNGSPILIRPGRAIRASFAVVAVPGETGNDGWTVYRRQSTKGAFDMAELEPGDDGLIRLSARDVERGAYGFTQLTSSSIEDSDSALLDSPHAIIATAPGDLTVWDCSLHGTSVEYVATPALDS